MTAFVTLAEIERALLHDKPRRRIIIPDVLPAGPCLIYGPSGVGKTGIAIRTAVAVAGGLQWADRVLSRGSVLYVVGEDIEGAKVRLVAAARELGLDPSALPVAIMEAPADGLVSNSARIAVVGAAQALAKNFDLPTAAVIVDTLAASFGPKSQDDATAASEYMSNADRTARELECAFLSIHHTGKNENSGMRGSRVFFDRADAVVKVNQGKGGVTFVEVEKMRNGPKGARFAYDIAGADLDTAGGTISVQVIRNLHALEPAAQQTRDEIKEKRDQTDAAVALVLLQEMAENGSASKRSWQDACFTRWADKPSSNARSRAFSTALRKMMTEGIITVDGDTVSVSMSKNLAHSFAHPSPPDTVSVSMSTTPLYGGVHSRTHRPSEAPFQKQGGADAEGRKAQHHGEVGRSNDLPRGAGVEDPAEDRRADHTHAHTGTED